MQAARFFFSRFAKRRCVCAASREAFGLRHVAPMGQSLGVEESEKEERCGVVYPHPPAVISEADTGEVD